MPDQPAIVPVLVDLGFEKNTTGVACATKRGGTWTETSVEDFRADLGVGYTTAAAMFVSYGVGGVVGNLVVAAGDGRSRKPVTVGGAAAAGSANTLPTSKSAASTPISFFIGLTSQSSERTPRTLVRGQCRTTHGPRKGWGRPPPPEGAR